MSWSRILRFARERQVPVIVTDETGEDPMILLSLDQLEQALGGESVPTDPTPVSPKPTTPTFVPEGAGEFQEDLKEVNLPTERTPEQVQRELLEAVEFEKSLQEAEIQTSHEAHSENEVDAPKIESVPQQRFTTQDNYGEIIVAPTISNEDGQGESDLVEETGVFPPDLASTQEGVHQNQALISVQDESQETIEARPIYKEQSAIEVPQVIWDGPLNMNLGLEEAVKEEGKEAISAKKDVPEEQKISEVITDVETKLNEVKSDLSLEERFFLDF